MSAMDLLQEVAVRNSVDTVRDAWWGVLTSLLKVAVDDADSLIANGTPERATQLAQAAGTLADAAIDEFESRWTNDL